VADGDSWVEGRIFKDFDVGISNSQPAADDFRNTLIAEYQ
jgi:hypothetical protein